MTSSERDPVVETVILWDHDGVLVDTGPLYYEASREALASLGVDLALDRYLADMGDGVSACERAVRDGPDPNVVQAQREWRDRRYQELLAERDIEIPGVEEARRLSPVTTPWPPRRHRW